MAEIVLKNIVKRYSSLIAVNNLNLNISDREFLVLLGPSGCGKTTTLRCISGLETPDVGVSAHYGGQPSRILAHRDARRRDRRRGLADERQAEPRYQC